jgi:hypothetical protein
VQLHNQSSKVDELVQLDHALVKKMLCVCGKKLIPTKKAERGVLNNPHTSADVNSLKLEYDALLALCQTQIATLEREQVSEKSKNRGERQ